MKETKIQNKTSGKGIHRYVPLLVLVFLSGIFIFTSAQSSPTKTQAQTTGSFVFGVAGDYGGNSNTDGVLTGIKGAGLNFQLAVGDLSYDTKSNPAGWGTYVKSILGTLPFVLVSGNHDESQIASFVAALPNPMSGVSGTYGNQYYFDYPSTGPLARFIMISPNVLSADPAWITSAIDGARSSGIKWVIVGMHKNCITTGQKTCEIGQALLTQLLSKKVDVILQGHDHNYQRSKQLTCATANTFTASCVVNAGSNFTKGAGSVLLIVGTGGNGHYSVSSGDSEAGYFSVINGDTFGFAKFTITPDKLSEQFVRTGGGTLSDAFTITGGSGTVPSLAPTTVPSPSPTVSFVCGGSQVCAPSITLTPLPTGSIPTVTTLPTETALPTQQTEPTTPIITTSASPTISPCVDGTASMQQTVRHKRNNPGAINGFMQLLLRLLVVLLNLISQLLGGSGTIVSPPGTDC